MVLTTYEAHGESAPANFESGSLTRHSPVMDPFNVRVVSHTASVSNGYYGYAIVNNVASSLDNNNNNNDINNCNNNNINNCNNNNNSVQAQPMQMQTNDIAGDDTVAAEAAAAAATAARCKKRCLTMGHEMLDMELDNLTAVKRCRFDDGDLVAQYCSDFFSLPATQVIGTQACLMDYDSEMHQQHHQQQQQQQQQPPGELEVLQQQQQQTEQQQQQQMHPRIHQHYQDGPEIESISDKLEAICEYRFTDEAADLYIATHGGCLHHYYQREEYEI